MMENPWVVLVATVLLIAASAFFVAVEFSLISARRHRLEDAAKDSAAARAALRNASELTLLLEGVGNGVGVLDDPPPPPQATRSPLTTKQIIGFSLNIKFSLDLARYFSPLGA